MVAAAQAAGGRGNDRGGHAGGETRSRAGGEGRERTSGEGREGAGGEGRNRGGRGRSNGRTRHEPATRVDAIDTALQQPAVELPRKEQLAGATALPEIAHEVADHPIVPVVVGPVTSDGLPSQTFTNTRHESNRHESNRHERRAQAAHGDHRAEQNGEHHGGPFGDHTPEFFAREQRRALQMTGGRAVR